jgi:di/tricarboxylate transporter
MARDTARSPSKLLIPLSYASQLGGVVTLIGTSANILASGLVSQAGFDGFSMFSFAPIGLFIFAVGAAYLMLVAPRLLPDRQGEQDLGATYDVKSYLSEVLIPEGSELDSMTLADSRLRQELGILVLQILRSTERILMIRGDTPLRAGDILVVSASAESLVQVRDDPRLEIEAQARLAADEAFAEDIRLLEVVIGPDSDLIGGTLTSTNFRNRFGATVIAMRKEGQIIRERLGRVRLNFGDTLLLQGPPAAIDLIRRRRGFIVTEEPRIESFRVRRIPMAIAIVAGGVGLAALGQPILVTAMVGAVLMVLTGCLTVTELHDAIRWDVLFLLAGMIPLGVALENTGGAQLLADLAVDAANYLPALGVLYVFYTVALLMTHLISSNPTIVVLIPVALATATSLGLDPEALALAIMFAASMSFSTPMGDQTNTLVYGPGGYRFSDYARTGLPLNLLLTVLTPIVIYTIWGL